MTGVELEARLACLPTAQRVLIEQAAADIVECIRLRGRSKPWTGRYAALEVLFRLGAYLNAKGVKHVASQ